MLYQLSYFGTPVAIGTRTNPKHISGTTRDQARASECYFHHPIARPIEVIAITAKTATAEPSKRLAINSAREFSSPTK